MNKSIIRDKYYNGDLFFNAALRFWELNLHLSVFGLQTWASLCESQLWWDFYRFEDVIEVYSLEIYQENQSVRKQKTTFCCRHSLVRFQSSVSVLQRRLIVVQTNASIHGQIQQPEHIDVPVRHDICVSVQKSLALF